MKPMTSIWMRRFGVMLTLCALMTFVPDMAQAQQNQRPEATPHGTCTTDPQFEIPQGNGGVGLISNIMINVKNMLGAIQQNMFQTIASDSGFRLAAQATMTLYIAFYGIMFIFAMVQITLYDFAIRMIKVGIIILLISPDAWYFFYNTVVVFFNDGTDSWINAISAAVLNQAPIPNAAPFEVIDRALGNAVSAKMAVTLMAMFFTPPYGPIFGLLLSLGLGTFVRAILTAAWVYLMSLILKALLFGLAPIFISFILFVRTRYLFDGWLNQVVNATLQPILLFTFLGFFVTLIGVSIDNILLNPVCWTEWGDSLRGTPFSVHYWRFATCLSSGECEPYGGNYSFNGSASNNAPIFPVDIVGILVLVILADLCARFNSIVVLIASDLASASTNLASMQGALGDWAKGGMSGGGKAPDGGGGGGAAPLPSEKLVAGEGKGGGNPVVGVARPLAGPGNVA